MTQLERIAAFWSTSLASRCVTLAIVLASSPGCSERARSGDDRDAGAPPTQDSGADERDGGTALDAASGRSDGGQHVDAGARLDAGARSDSGSARDAGIARDAGLQVDAGSTSPMAGDGCDTAIDVDTGGVLSATTCGLGDEATASCNGSGAPDRIYFVHGVDRLAAYNISVSDGFVWYSVAPGAGPRCTTTGTCLPSSSVLARSPFYFAVEKVGGGCGTYTLTVTPPPL